MKKLLTLILVMVLALSLFACKGNDPEPTPTPDPVIEWNVEDAQAYLESYYEDEKTVTIKTGNLPKDKTVRLILAYDEGTPEDTEVYLNGSSVGALTPCEAPDAKYSAYTDGAKCYDTTLTLVSDTQSITIKRQR